MLEQLKPTSVTMVRHIEEAEADEMGRFVYSKQQERWLWHAIDHQTGQVLAYVLADHKDQALVELKALLEPFGVPTFYTTGGERMPAYWLKNSMALASGTLRKLSANT